MRKIIYTNADGGITVVHPVRNTIGEQRAIVTAARAAVMGLDEDTGEHVVITPAVEEVTRTMTDAEIEQRAWDALPPEALATARWVAADAIPADRTFRNAWAFDGATVSVDMPKAREIQRDRLRAERAPLFAANDLAARDALLAGDVNAQKAAAARRDELRDVTADPRIDAARTPEELAAITIG